MKNFLLIKKFIFFLFSVAQTLIAAKAYDMEPDWAAALYERWVLKGDKTFYSDLKSSNLLTPHLLHVTTHRFVYSFFFVDESVNFFF